MGSLASPFTESKDPEFPGVCSCCREAFSPRTRPHKLRAENSLPVSFPGTGRRKVPSTPHDLPSDAHAPLGMTE